MPFAILGIPWLASTVLGVLGGIVSFFATYIGKRIALMIIVIAACLVLVGIFFAALESLIAGISWSSLAGGTGFHLFIPTGFSSILSLWLTAKIAFWLYSWNVKIATLKIL